MNTKDYMSGRNDGLNTALKILDTEGREALVEFIKWRGAMPKLPSQILNKAIEEEIERSRKNILTTVLLCACETLNNEFDFGAKRLKRFADRFTEISDCIGKDYVTWEDLQKEMAEKMGLHITISDDLIKFETKE